jgi:predicted transcriptional regulator
MVTLTVKVDEETAAWLDRQAHKAGGGRSTIIRQALALLRKRSGKGSALEAAGDLVGSVRSGVKDLGSNKRHLKGFGR